MTSYEHFHQILLQRTILRTCQRIQSPEMVLIDNNTVIEVQKEAHGDPVDDISVGARPYT